MDFDPDFYDSTGRTDIDQDTGHIGATIRMSPKSTLLAAAFLTDRREKFRDDPSSDDPSSKDRFSEDGYQGEVQYVWTGATANFVGGGGTYDFDLDARSRGESSVHDAMRQQKVYAYLGVRPTPRSSLRQVSGWTNIIGVRSTGTSYRRKPASGGPLRPGSQFAPPALRALKGALVVEQTLEPTEVSGFTQLFDDFNGTVSDLYGLGVDMRLGDDVYTGIEAYVREITVPIPDDSGYDVIDFDEELLRGYTYWTVNDRLALTAQVELDRFSWHAPINPLVPEHANTTTISLGGRYRHPNGFFVGIIGNLVHQDIERASFSEFPEGNDTFLSVDASIGYRLPERHGVLRLDMQNSFNQGFNYLDDNFRVADNRAIAPYAPERSLLFRVVLNF